MQKVTPFLWFDNNAEEAMNFYVATFPNSEIISSTPGPDGKLMSGTIRVADQELMFLNGGPQFKFNQAISLFVNCVDQAEVDDLWGKLLADGGEEGNCGWIKDKFGLWWQIVPQALGELLGDPDREKANKALQAMLKMHKIIVTELSQ